MKRLTLTDVLTGILIAASAFLLAGVLFVSCGLVAP